mmetsp:Transcript_1295/g.2845  ORF Transcript_1295/g.2845 Transcript_1295/m.2845 type:complete len:237 (-) Transcript_1295:1021-1731(-)
MELMRHQNALHTLSGGQGGRLILLFGQTSHHLGGTTARKAQFDFLQIGWHGNGGTFGFGPCFVLEHESGFEASHFVFLAMYQDNMFGSHFLNKGPILHKIHVRRKTHVIHQTIQGLTSSFQCDNFLGLCHDFLGQGMFDGISGNQNAIVGIGSPPIKQLSRYTGLQHSWTGKDHGGSGIIKGIDINTFQIGNVLKLKGIADIHLRPDASVHHIGVGLVNSQGAGGQFGCVPNGNIL